MSILYFWKSPSWRKRPFLRMTHLSHVLTRINLIHNVIHCRIKINFLWHLLSLTLLFQKIAYWPHTLTRTKWFRLSNQNIVSKALLGSGLVSMDLVHCLCLYFKAPKNEGSWQSSSVATVRSPLPPVNGDQAFKSPSPVRMIVIKRSSIGTLFQTCTRSAESRHSDHKLR